MTRTDTLASSGPHAAGAHTTRVGARRVPGRFLGLIVASLFAAALVAPTAALAASTGESGYSQTPSTPKTTTTTSKPSEPKSGTSPSKEVSPSKAATTSTSPTSTTTETAKTLPFTGLDLRWIVVAGVLMMAAGFSIVTLQRRQRRGNWRR